MAKIGLEIHAYLNLDKNKTKLFCECPVNYQEADPNTNICPICTSQPGSKPMAPNKDALNKVIAIGLLLNCKINKKFFFQRKHYDWPDLPSGYQRTVSGSYSTNVGVNGKFSGIGIWEVHLEEDPAKWDPKTGEVDYNRSGMPLIEIVTAPELKTPEEARKWLRSLMTTLNYIKAVPKNVAVKADVNVSVEGHPRVEVKNVNSFKNVCKAIEYEFMRQEKALKDKTALTKEETRMFDENEGVTKHMRYKEQADDYRFIPEPDLPTIYLEDKYVNEIEKDLPENPEEKAKRFTKQYNLSKYDAEVLTQELMLAELFEQVAKEIDSKLAANWLMRDMLRLINESDTESIEMDEGEVIDILDMFEKGEVTNLVAKDLLRGLIEGKVKNVREYVKKQALGKVSEKEDLRKWCLESIEKNPVAVNDFKKGREKALDALLGYVMRISGKKANPEVVKKLLKELLK